MSEEFLELNDQVHFMLLDQVEVIAARTEGIFTTRGKWMFDPDTKHRGSSTQPEITTSGTPRSESRGQVLVSEKVKL